MRFSSVEIVIAESALKRRVLRFYLSDTRLVLDYDCDEERETSRHKFREIRSWSWLRRGAHRMHRRDVPPEVVTQALAAVRAQIKYVRWRGMVVAASGSQPTCRCSVCGSYVSGDVCATRVISS